MAARKLPQTTETSIFRSQSAQTRKAQRHGRSFLSECDNVKIAPELFQRSKTRLCTLSDPLLKRAKRLWPYVKHFKRCAKWNEKTWITEFEYNMEPECDILWWEKQVLTVLDVLYLASMSKVDLTAGPVDEKRMQDAVKLPLLATQVLDESYVLDYFYETKLETLELIFDVVYGIRNEQREIVDQPFGHVMILALARIEVCMEEDQKRIDLIQEAMIGTAFGAACAQCKKMGHNLKKCGICQETYYCNKTCQKKHWPVHKKTCKKKERKKEKGGKADKAKN